MTEEEETAMCNKIAAEAADVIINRISAAGGMNRAAVLAAEMVAAVILIKTESSSEIISLFCNRVESRLAEFKRNRGGKLN